MWGEVTYPITSVVCKKKAAVVGIPGQSGLHETISKKSEVARLGGTGFKFQNWEAESGGSFVSSRPAWDL